VLYLLGDVPPLISCSVPRRNDLYWSTLAKRIRRVVAIVPVPNDGMRPARVGAVVVPAKFFAAISSPIAGGIGAPFALIRRTVAVGTGPEVVRAIFHALPVAPLIMLGTLIVALISAIGVTRFPGRGNTLGLSPG
jgi:hypothetical protein